MTNGAAPLFVIRYDAEAKKHTPSRVNVRLVPRTPSDTTPQIDWEEVKITPAEADYLTFSEVELVAPGDTVRFKVEPAQALLASPDFTRKVAKPVTVTIEARPKPRTATDQPKRINRQCQVRVEAKYEIKATFEPEPPRTYADLQLRKKGEFVADSYDQLTITFSAHRLDGPPDEAHPDARLTVRPDPEGGAFYWWKDESFAEPGKVRGTVRADRPLLHTADNAGRGLRLRVEATIPGPDGEELQLEPLDQELLPRFLAVKPWVVPGAQPGTSEAGAWVWLAPEGGQALKGVSLELKVEAEGGGDGPTLRLAGPSEAQTGASGTALWSLSYGGLTWDNAAAARFKVKVAIRGKQWSSGRWDMSEAAVVRVEVGRNLRELLETLGASAGALSLTNPEFQDPRWYDWLFPNSWRGGYYNIRSFVGGGDHYTCNHLRERIYNWLDDRRHGGKDPDLPLRMNGIEIAQFYIAPIHVFAGIHLSGMSTSDAYMIDPWWDQEWGDKTLLTWSSELGKTSSFVIAALPLLAPILAKATAAGSIAAAWIAIKEYMLKGIISKIFSGIVGGTLAAGSYYFRWGTDTDEFLTPSGTYKTCNTRLLAAQLVRRWQGGGQAAAYVDPVESW